MVTPSNPFSTKIISAPPSLGSWLPLLASSLTILRRLAGSTEREFLQIGSQMQGIYQRSLVLTQTARRLVEVASSERIQILMDKLRQILQEMEAYLEQAQVRTLNSCTSLDTVETLLRQVAEPLEGFRKMSKHLYILEVAIKIESTYLGDMESEFLNLAQDIKLLSQQVKEKANAVHDHRLVLSAVIKKNNVDIHIANVNQDAKVQTTLGDTAASLSKLESVNERFSRLGSAISTVAEENSHNISGIVQSMQFHDIYRQQVEHVLAALEGFASSLSEGLNASSAGKEIDSQELISKAGDVCELQEAQLQFASAELYAAVTAIVTNLCDISAQQKQIGKDCDHTGVIDGSSATFIDDVSRHMSSITNLLTTCATTNNELAKVTGEVTSTVAEITAFVADIENIAHEIIQIALNSRIKAACTGKNGAALSALSEEIGHLSTEAVQWAGSITATLTKIDAATEVLSTEASSNEEILRTKLFSIKEELNKTLTLLDDMGAELLSLLPQIQSQINLLTMDIDRIATGIDVHERTKALADAVLGNLQQVFRESRALYPASAAFKEDLRLMAQRYTMESERRIHEDIASRYGVNVSTPQALPSVMPKNTDSEFGDNVDLF